MIPDWLMERSECNLCFAHNGEITCAQRTYYVVDAQIYLLVDRCETLYFALRNAPDVALCGDHGAVYALAEDMGSAFDAANAPLLKAVSETAANRYPYSPPQPEPGMWFMRLRPKNNA